MLLNMDITIEILSRAHNIYCLLKQTSDSIYNTIYVLIETLQAKINLLFSFSAKQPTSMATESETPNSYLLQYYKFLADRIYEQLYVLKSQQQLLDNLVVFYEQKINTTDTLHGDRHNMCRMVLVNNCIVQNLYCIDETRTKFTMFDYQYRELHMHYLAIQQSINLTCERPNIHAYLFQPLPDYRIRYRQSLRKTIKQLDEFQVVQQQLWRDLVAQYFLRLEMINTSYELSKSLRNYARKAAVARQTIKNNYDKKIKEPFILLMGEYVIYRKLEIKKQNDYENHNKMITPTNITNIDHTERHNKLKCNC